MIKISQETLCTFCEENMETNRNTCEGSRCEEVREMFLEDSGIEESTSKTFQDVIIKDKIYVLDDDGKIPCIVTEGIIGIALFNGNVTITTTDNNKKTFTITVEKADLGKSKIGNKFFLIKKDANKVIESLCIDRLIKLSKVIGSISK